MRGILLCLLTSFVLLALATTADAKVRDVLAPAASCQGGTCSVPVTVEVAKPVVKIEKTVTITKTTEANTTAATVCCKAPIRTFFSRFIRR